MTVASTTMKLDLKALDELSERWDRLSEMTTSAKADTERMAVNAAQALVGAVREVVISMPRSPRSFSRSGGELGKSFREAAKVSDGRIYISALSDLIYARIVDRGGTIRPRSRQYLSIPMTSKAAARWPRDWDRKDLFVQRGKTSRKPYLAQREGKKVKVQYLLRKQVEIKAKRYLDKARDAALPVIGRIFVRFLASKVVSDG